MSRHVLPTAPSPTTTHLQRITCQPLYQQPATCACSLLATVFSASKPQAVLHWFIHCAEICQIALHRLALTACSALRCYFYENAVSSPVLQIQGCVSREFVLDSCDHHSAHRRFAPLYTSSSRARPTSLLLSLDSPRLLVGPCSFFDSACVSNGTE